jgi:hypothetical protein
MVLCLTESMSGPCNKPCEELENLMSYVVVKEMCKPVMIVNQGRQDAVAF